MAATTASKEKAEVIAKLGKLLGQVAGIETPWETIANDLRSEVPLRTLKALLYRIERTLANSYEEGHKHGQIGASA